MLCTEQLKSRFVYLLASASARGMHKLREEKYVVGFKGIHHRINIIYIKGNKKVIFFVLTLTDKFM